MPDEIQSLIDRLRGGQYDDPSEKIGLLSAALQEHEAEIALILSLLRAPQIPLRLAAIDACRRRAEPELVSALADLVHDSESRIRVKLAETLRHHASKTAGQALHALLADPDDDVREAALKSTSGRPEFCAAQEIALAKDPEWNVRLAAANALEAQQRPEVAKALLEALVQDADDDVQRRCAEAIEKRLIESPAPTESHLPAEISRLAKAERALKQLGKHRFPALVAWIAARTTINVDPEVLAKFGTDLTAMVSGELLPRAHGVEEAVETLLKLIHREPWRSVALLGEAGVGKTALINELVYQLSTPENGAWRVLRVSPADFMSGTRYLGEWETKVRELVDAIKKPRRVVLYVPNLSDLSAAGTWSKSDNSVATALAPYLEEGSVLLLGESAPDEYERGLGRIPSLARLFDKVLVPEPSLDRTRAILRAVRKQEKSELSDDVLDQLLEISAQFLGHICRPGCAIELLKAAAKTEQESGRPSTFRDVLNLLSKSTGVPVDLLDDSIPLQSATLRAFFEKRILGQPEAVDAIVDLVTLIKAGVTDPGKPFAVYLFVGPTGVGKTELARALAEFIFGDAARLKRFDMSEFASADGFTRLIGGNNENGLLTDTVRQHPFSVVLLDEIEKAHLNVFDLCLQIFDAGRLTVGRGRTIDFRRTIVILTSNIGASSGATPLGFGTPRTDQTADVDKDRTFRELSRFFRPEFLNRLDRIVQFRALSLDVAEQIARHEVDLVLQRSGIRRRQLVVDIDASAISLLVREGYSPHFGARPLKRTVERLLLLPVARAIASGSLRGRTVLRLTERAGRIDALMSGRPPSPDLPGEMPAQAVSSLADRLRQLQSAYAGLQDALQPLADRKSELILQTQQPNFFRHADLRSATLGEIHNLDQFLQLHQSVRKALTGMEEQFARRAVSNPEESAVEAKLDRLQAELAHLRFVSECKDAKDLGDTLLTISLVDRTGAAQGAVQKLAEMYRSLGARRRMTTEVLGELFDEKRDRAYLLVAGLGAYALLRNECGLHQVDRRFKERAPRSGREVIREDRELIRVEVHPAATSPAKPMRQKIKAKAVALKPAPARLLHSELAVSLFDERTLRSLEFWTTGPKEDAVERALMVLESQVLSDPAPDGQESIIRRYDLGMSPKVKDTRTGRTTTRVEQFLNGELGLFLELSR